MLNTIEYPWRKIPPQVSLFQCLMFAFVLWIDLDSITVYSLIDTYWTTRTCYDQSLTDSQDSQDCCPGDQIQTIPKESKSQAPSDARCISLRSLKTWNFEVARCKHDGARGFDIGSGTPEAFDKNLVSWNFMKFHVTGTRMQLVPWIFMILVICMAIPKEFSRFKVHCYMDPFNPFSSELLPTPAIPSDKLWSLNVLWSPRPHTILWKSLLLLTGTRYWCMLTFPQNISNHSNGKSQVQMRHCVCNDMFWYFLQSLLCVWLTAPHFVWGLLGITSSSVGPADAWNIEMLHVFLGNQ